MSDWPMWSIHPPKLYCPQLDVAVTEILSFDVEVDPWNGIDIDRVVWVSAERTGPHPIAYRCLRVFLDPGREPSRPTLVVTR